VCAVVPCRDAITYRMIGDSGNTPRACAQVLFDFSISDPLPGTERFVPSDDLFYCVLANITRRMPPSEEGWSD